MCVCVCLCVCVCERERVCRVWLFMCVRERATGSVCARELEGGKDQAFWSEDPTFETP